MKKIEEVSIVGLGLVGQTLARFFLEKGIKIKQIVVRKFPNNKLYDVQYIDSMKALQAVDLVLICVNDASLEDVVNQIPKEQLTAYTSGAVGLNQFSKRDDLAVFYPLQSFAHLNPEAVTKIPILIEAKNPTTRDQLQEFALRYFETCEEINSEKRAQLHLAAVFANNFTNHLIHLAQKLCDENNLSFDLLKPLIAESAQKWMDLPAEKLQTGPAIRGDWNVIEHHKTRLSDELREIYEVMTESIVRSRREP
jgi:predicted short-subunit dehydrogenase-like oxidoreductase (DUF2520 family)